MRVRATMARGLFLSMLSMGCSGQQAEPPSEHSAISYCKSKLRLNPGVAVDSVSCKSPDLYRSVTCTIQLKWATEAAREFASLDRAAQTLIMIEELKAKQTDPATIKSLSNQMKAAIEFAKTQTLEIRPARCKLAHFSETGYQLED